MGNSEEVKVSKPEKPSSPATDQNNVHVYPDWATMQAYYGPRLAVPPYMNSAIASPHTTTPYMWGTPQSMIPPYGAPYGAFYAHPGLYTHPSVTVASTPLSLDTAPAKSTGNGNGGFVKKLKEFDGLAMSIGNGNGDSAEHGNDQKVTDSEDTGGSSDGSNGITPRANQDAKKRSRQSSPNTENGKPEKKSSSSTEMEVDRAPKKKIGDSISTGLDLSDPASVPLHSVPHEIWLQNERELKRERRKQSNRESARRSRLRKQAEAEELAAKVQVLTAEKMTLKSEISKLMENSEKLKHENATLMEKLKNAQLGQSEEVNLHKINDDLRRKPIGTVNLLERVNNSSDLTEVTDNGDSSTNTSPKAKASTASRHQPEI